MPLADRSLLISRQISPSQYAIETELKALIADSELSNAENVVTLIKVIDANRGPGWNDQKSVNLAGQALDFATAYANAPLYTYAQKKYPTLLQRTLN